MGIFVVGIPSAVSFAAKQNISTVHIELSEPVVIDAFMASIKKQKFEEMVLESSFIFDGKEIYDFHIVQKDEQNKNLATDYANNRKVLIADIKNITNFSSKEKKEIENIKIKKVTFTGTNGNIDKVKKNLKIRKVDIADASVMQKSQEAPRPSELETTRFFGTPASAATTPQTQPMYLSLPTSGQSKIKNSIYPNERYSVQYMQWDTNNFTPEQTYEHKLYLYNYDEKTFLNGESTSYPNCYPTLLYAATTWGSASEPYLDTRFDADFVSCETDELSYTIGAAQANAIASGTNHYTYIRTANGNDSTDKFKIQAQVGFRNPDVCYRTWCSAKYKIYNLIPSWSTVPCTQAWTYSGQTPEAPSNVVLTDPTTSSLKLHFADNSYDETDIYVERRISGSSYVSLGSFGLLNLTSNWYWTNTGLQSNQVYCYRLRAKNALGYSSYSNSACASTQ